MMRRGFTIVELVITITIMGILLTLAVVNLTTTQINGRDTERNGDVEALALNLENFYANQNSDIANSGGTYPSTNIMDDAHIKATLPDLDPKSSHAPGADTSGPISVVAATNNVQTTAGVLPQPTTSTYVYQPITKTGALCTDLAALAATNDSCRKFNLFYRLEKDNTVYMVTSKHQ